MPGSRGGRGVSGETQACLLRGVSAQVQGASAKQACRTVYACNSAGRTHTHTHAHTRAHTHTWHLHTRAHACAHTCTQAHTHAPAHVPTHTCTHCTHTHTPIETAAHQKVMCEHQGVQARRNAQKLKIRSPKSTDREEKTHNCLSRCRKSVC